MTKGAGGVLTETADLPAESSNGGTETERGGVLIEEEDTGVMNLLPKTEGETEAETEAGTETKKEMGEVGIERTAGSHLSRLLLGPLMNPTVVESLHLRPM